MTTQEGLEARIADLENTIEAAETGTWSWERSTNQHNWSDRCKALFGLPSDTQIDHELFLSRIYPADRDRVDAAVRAALSEGTAYDIYSRVILPEGAIRWLRFKGRAYADASGRITSFRGIVIDATFLKAAESDASDILESIAEGFYGLDVNYRFTYVNRSAEEMLGRRRDEILGHSLWDAIPETLGTEMEANYRRAMTERTTVEFATFFEPWSRWFNVKIYPSPSGLAVYFREITKQKQMEMALLDTQERFEMINNFIPVMVWTTRPDGYHDYFNRRWMEYTGLSPQQTHGWEWSHLIHPDDRERTMARWQHSIQTGEPYEIEYRIARSSDNTYRWFLGQALPVRNQGGKIVRWFGTCTDIDDRKRVETELASARQTAEEASQAKSRFLASMSHELRTPLNAIIGYSEMLEEEFEELGIPQLTPDLKKVHSAGKHLLALISDILDLSKIEAGKMDIFAESFDVATAVNEVVATVEPLVKKNNNRLELRVEPGIGRMTSDLTKVRQTLFNLLSNAGKFTKDGVVTTQVHADGDRVVFRVTDTGAGIPKDRIGQLFEPFSQLHDKSLKAGGTGLGLAITERFVTMLEGEISVDSTEGQGSTFTIRLPRAINPPLAAEPDAVAPDRDRNRGRGLVLVIDDDATARDLMNRYLIREGYRPALASSGEEGLRLAHELRPDVITLDVIMPGMDGWAVLQHLKADPELACIPVVMVTMTGDRSLGFSLGAADYVIKPVTREKLGAIISRFRCANPPCRILIVEDDQSSRELVSTIFSKEGWTVETASNGVEGLQAVSQNRPSLILLDLMMPVMDGFEFTMELKSKRETRDIPIVVLTARDLTSEDRARLTGNVQKVLSKAATSTQEVLSQIRETLNQCMET